MEIARRAGGRCQGNKNAFAMTAVVIYFPFILGGCSLKGCFYVSKIIRRNFAGWPIDFKLRLSCYPGSRPCR